MRYVESLNQALHSMMRDDSRVFVVGEDLLDPYGGAFKVTRGLSTAFPGRVIPAPIAEASIVGFGTGLALQGLRPVVEIMFGDFVLLAADQIVNSATKYPMMFNGQVQVPLVIRTPMGARRGYGPTHSQTLETFFLNTPGLEIVAPSHLYDPGTLLRRATLESDAVTLFVENKTLYALDLFPGGSGHETWSVRELGTPTPWPMLHVSLRGVSTVDVVLLAYGGMAPIALEAAKVAFLEDEIAVACIIPSRIKPLSVDLIAESAAATGRVVIAEESVRYGGWGAELGAQLAERRVAERPLRIRRVGAPEFIVPSSTRLEEQVVPQVGGLVRAIRELVREH